jgi:hypothetical protein
MAALVAMPRHREGRRRVASSGEAAIPPLCRFEVAGVVKVSTNALRCALPTPLMATRVLGRPVSNAVSSGRRKRTKRLRNIRSMCRDIARWDVNEVQIPGNKIEPQWSFLDTLVLVLQRGFTLVGSSGRCDACDVRDRPHGFSVDDRRECPRPIACQTRGGVKPLPAPASPGATSPPGLFF